MRCAAVTDRGTICTRRPRWGRLYCNQHGILLGMNPRIEERAAPERTYTPANPRPVPVWPAVSPTLIATLLRQTGIPPSYRRMVATEFCEAFVEASGQMPFDAQAFLAAADVVTERKDVV
jgi:hypothetical protein